MHPVSTAGCRRLMAAYRRSALDRRSKSAAAISKTTRDRPSIARAQNASYRAHCTTPRAGLTTLARASKGTSPEQDNTPTSALGRYTGSGRDRIRHRHHYRRRKDPVWRRRRKSRRRQHRSLRSLVQFRCWLCIRYRGFRIALVEALGSPTVGGDSRRDNCRVHRVRNLHFSWWRVRGENGRCNDYS